MIFREFLGSDGTRTRDLRRDRPRRPARDAPELVAKPHVSRVYRAGVHRFPVATMIRPAPPPHPHPIGIVARTRRHYPPYVDGLHPELLRSAFRPKRSSDGMTAESAWTESFTTGAVGERNPMASTWAPLSGMLSQQVPWTQDLRLQHGSGLGDRVRW
jgi:hypothetical protein